ncbi:hypothetical protein SAMD00019534_080670 [Acytostelium subglobosum LB1]|nr:hypothetical protein SAMD00019534_080670 [Acytostelium subglobosum LB1]GAM24892.1 hypothetical protein SAMD00019534_080670 [Acytostelium subglobosum LB1]|eukprot:XP_012751981.1 hypothetical protein SAMD00019534_080670 [Acytostelium subglobosum LB1]
MKSSHVSSSVLMGFLLFLFLAASTLMYRHLPSNFCFLSSSISDALLIVL